MSAQIWEPSSRPDQHCFRENNCADHLDYSGPNCCCCGWLAESHSGCDCPEED